MNTELLLIGESPAIRRLRKDIPHYAKTQKHLLLKGEPGVGKGLIVRLIYGAAGLKGPLSVINPVSADDAEVARALVDHRTLGPGYFFQNIERFTFLQQALLHKFLSTLPQKPPALVFVTAGQSVGELRRQHRITAELADDLNAFEVVSVPSLAQRVADIPLLVNYFVKHSCEQLGIKPKTIDPGNLDFLCRHDWKENVRELKAVVERSVLSSPGDIVELPEQLLDEYAQLENMVTMIKGRRPFSFDKVLYNLEKTMIERALDVLGYNQSRAADLLKLSEANLRYRLKKFHIPTSQEQKKKL